MLEVDPDRHLAHLSRKKGAVGHAFFSKGSIRDNDDQPAFALYILILFGTITPFVPNPTVGPSPQMTSS
jgi:hypothetical protein